jgi:hypothetical protein
MSGWAADPYVYPSTRVLRNRLDIRDPARLARLDADLSALALAELADQHLPGRYDLAHLQGFHQAMACVGPVMTARRNRRGCGVLFDHEKQDAPGTSRGDGLRGGIS